MISTGGEGKISARKRLRGKIGDPSAHPELKQYNMLDTSEGLTGFYRSVNVYGVYVADNLDYAGVWKPVPLLFPPLGVAAGGRIGKRIRVKYLRLKGYVAASPFLITQVRYRLVLYRTRKNFVAGTEAYKHDWLRSLYSSFQNLEDETDNAALLQRACVKNYYQSFFDANSLKEKDCKRRVLFKGLIKPSQDIGNYKFSAADTGYFRTVPVVGANVDTINGQAAGTLVRAAQFNTGIGGDITISGEFVKHAAAMNFATEINSKSFFPIDVTVNMNDNVDVWEYRYVLVLEADCGIGQGADGGFDDQVDNSNFFLSLVPQIYYTDD